MDASKLSEVDIECVKAYAECDMSRTETAKRMYLCNNSVIYHLEKVKRITGLNPRRFHDLVKLLEMFEEVKQ